ncbi:MAG: hypothetical protein Tsb0021_00260 [Chlamydiales bacterium]
MTTLILVLIPIVITDLINPILLAGIIYGLGSRQPIINAWTILFSFFISYFAAGIVIALGIEYFSKILDIPGSFDYVLEFIVAVLLFYFAWKMWRSGDEHLEEQLNHDRSMSLKDALVIGFNINLIGLPFALPYLAAIDQILKANLNPLTATLVLVIYNLIYILPFAGLIILWTFYQEKSGPIFRSVSNWMHRFIEKYLPILFLILGLLLIEDVVSYFLGYREYSFLSLTDNDFSNQNP